MFQGREFWTELVNALVPCHRQDSTAFSRQGVLDCCLVNQKERVEFHFDAGCEGMIWTTGGVPMQGLTGGHGGDRRVEYILPHEWRNEPDAPHVRLALSAAHERRSILKHR